MGVVFSVFVYYCTIFLMSADSVAKTFQPNMENVFPNLLGSPKAWILLLFTPLLALLPDFFIKTWRKAYSPDPLDRLVAAQRQGMLQTSTSA